MRGFILTLTIEVPDDMPMKKAKNKARELLARFEDSIGRSDFELYNADIEEETL